MRAFPPRNPRRLLAIATLAVALGPGHSTTPGAEHGAGHPAGHPPKHAPSRITATHPERYAFQVSPTRIFLPPAKGPEMRTFTVSDIGKIPLTVHISIAEYTQRPDGTIIFQPPGPLSAASWVHVRRSTLAIRPGTMRTVRVRVAVPPHPEPGERYLAVIFRTPPRVQRHHGRNIAVSGAIGAEMLVNVPGPVVHRVALSHLSSPGFSTGGNIPLTVTVRNLGTEHQQFAGRTQLTARYGRQAIQFPSFIVLRSASRILTADWTSHPWMCICSLRLTTSNGDGHPITATTQIVIFPLWTALGTLFIVTGLALLTRHMRRRARARITKHSRRGATA
jgi:hypothetical protein